MGRLRGAASAGGRGAAGAPHTNYGDRVLIGDQTASTSGRIVQPPDKRVRLLDVAASDDQPGSWVVAVSTEVLLESTGAAAGPNVLRATASMGSGGVARVMQFDCAPGAVFAVPSQVLQLDVELDTLGIGPNYVRIPRLQECTATVERSWSATAAHLTTFFADTINIPLQKLATHWMVYADRSSNVYSADVWYRFYSGGSAKFQQARYDGTDVFAALRAGNPLPVPPFCSDVQIQFTVGPGALDDAAFSQYVSL